MRGTIYLKFGKDYREDFTVKISPRDFRAFDGKTQNQITSLPERLKYGMTIETRGWKFNSSGLAIEIRVGGQLDFYHLYDSLILERSL